MTPPPDSSQDWSWVPHREWEWRDDETTQGVHTFEGQLVWWGQPDGAGGHFGGVARTQSFEDFLTNGPALSSAPMDVVEEIGALLAKRPRKG